MHITMIILHIVAVVAFAPALFVTIPFHFLLTSQEKKNLVNKQEKPTSDPRSCQVLQSLRLIDAASFGRVEDVKALLSAGANPNATRSDGKTALLLAQKHGHSEVVRILKEAGAQ